MRTNQQVWKEVVLACVKYLSAGNVENLVSFSEGSLGDNCVQYYAFIRRLIASGLVCRWEIQTHWINIHSSNSSGDVGGEIKGYSL
jgi:hypothetical protein